MNDGLVSDVDEIESYLAKKDVARVNILSEIKRKLMTNSLF